MRKDLYVYAAVAAVAGIACWLREGEAAVRAVMIDLLHLCALVVPSLFAAMILAAFMSEIIRHETVARWLGRDSGLRGLGVASLLGGATPGGPFASFPIVRTLALAGADFGALVAFVTGWSVIAFSRMLVWEIPLMGGEFAALRFAVTLVLPVVAALLARLAMRAFGDPIAHMPAQAGRR
jgi:uncharacterized membrane protein YraQ (UPF0718 family)